MINFKGFIFVGKLFIKWFDERMIKLENWYFVVVFLNFYILYMFGELLFDDVFSCKMY